MFKVEQFAGNLKSDRLIRSMIVFSNATQPYSFNLLHFRLRSETFGIFGPVKFWFSLKCDQALLFLVGIVGEHFL